MDMPIPRWFLISCGLLAASTLIVASTPLWRDTRAQEPTVPSQLEPADPTKQADPTDQANQEQPELPPSLSSGVSDLETDPLPSLPSLEQLPEVPSLDNAEALRKNPIFQEFRNLFSDQQGKDLPLSLDGISDRAGEEVQGQGDEYFEALDARLATVGRLNASARSIAQEAARMSQHGRSARSTKLLQMATQLREMAAELLVTGL